MIIASLPFIYNSESFLSLSLFSFPPFSPPVNVASQTNAGLHWDFSARTPGRVRASQPGETEGFDCENPPCADRHVTAHNYNVILTVNEMMLIKRDRHHNYER